MRATTTSIEDVLRDTHNSPEAFVKRFGVGNTKLFVRLFGKQLCDSMELPISEAVDALDRVYEINEKTGKYSQGVRLADNSQERGMFLIERILEAAERFDELNNLMGFLRGLGSVAQEFGYKDSSYFEYQLRTWQDSSFERNHELNFFGYINELVRLAERSQNDMEQNEVGKMYKDLFASSVHFSENIKSAFHHLEIVQMDLKSG
jgi:hypothetical protein